jgi:hypothetical protein
MVFAVCVDSQPDKIRFVGVDGFTAEDGTCYLPDAHMADLGLRNGERVTLYNCDLPKCTSVTLRASEQAHSILDSLGDPCSLLESALKGRVCL